MKLYLKFIKITIPIILILVLFVSISLVQSNNAFDETILDVDNIYNHIEILTSEKYYGRMAGSDGNEKAMLYVENYFREIGIKPAGLDGTYYQNFSTIIPDIDTEPVFNIKSTDGTIIKQFTMYEDYKLTPSINGGSVDFSGEFIFVNSNLFRIDPALIKDRIVVIVSNQFDPKKVNYVIENGGKGIFCSLDRYSYMNANKYELEKTISISGKTGESIMVGYLSKDTYSFMINYMVDNDIPKGDNYIGIIDNVSVKANIGFPIIETANVIGKIDGKSTNGRTLLITANIDGTGEGIAGKYFPGAISSASGISTLFEVARVISVQESLPYETIVFIGFNAQQQQLAGSNYYIDNPIFALDKTSVIHLGNLGEVTREGMKISSDNINSAIMRNNISNYAKDAELTTEKIGQAYSPANQFANKKIAAVMFSDVLYNLNSYGDTIECVEKEALENSAQVLLNYVKRDVFKDVSIDYLSLLDKLLIYVLAFGLAINYIFIRLYKTSPNMKIGKSRVEDIYFYPPVTILRNIYFYGVPIIGVVFLLGFLANIDPESNIKIVNNEVVTNFSGYLTVKESILYIKNIFTTSATGAYKADELLKVIFNASSRTIKLISVSLLLSSIIGIARGIYEGYKVKNNNLRYFSTLIVFSIPDVLIVLIGMLAYIYIAQNFPSIKSAIPLKDFIMPLITLSILPTIYISRITFITIEEEIKKDYVKNAKAKGLSKKKIFAYEILPAIVFKIVDTMPTIMTMLISNMIVVEYLFNYTGIVYYLLYFFKRHDVNGFIALSITLGIIFIIFTWGIKFIAKLINPLKREEGQ